MVKHLVLITCFFASHVSASNWRPPERFLQAVRYVESTDGLYTWGDNGRSLGDYQLSEAAWIDVNAWRKARRLPLFDYEIHVWNRNVSRVYAADYLSILHHELKKRLNRPPKVVEVYAAYNMGLTSFAQCNYDLARVNSTTARKCQVIQAIVESR